MLLPGQQVTSACVQVFIKCMHEKLVQQARIEDFGFLCPVYASTTSKELRQEYISKRVCEVPRKVYLFPNWLGNHYQLVVMNMESHYVIFLCSTHSDPSTTLKRIINNGMTTFQRTVKKGVGLISTLNGTNQRPVGNRQNRTYVALTS
ncbi:hypothetical protein K1719_009476 [Acacia pycnantha]|nr:hypothetical protein K1719_009476 [Acacia pycnantha]